MPYCEDTECTVNMVYCKNAESFDHMTMAEHLSRGLLKCTLCPGYFDPRHQDRNEDSEEDY